MCRISLIGPKGEIDKASDKILIDGEVFMHLIAKVGTGVKLKSKFLKIAQNKTVLMPTVSKNMFIHL